MLKAGETRFTPCNPLLENPLFAWVRDSSPPHFSSLSGTRLALGGFSGFPLFPRLWEGSQEGFCCQCLARHSPALPGGSCSWLKGTQVP